MSEKKLSKEHIKSKEAKEKQKNLLIEIMKKDEEDGLYESN